MTNPIISDLYTKRRLMPAIRFSIILSFLLLIHSCHSQKNPKQPVLASEDEAIFRAVQQQTFQYFYSGAEPVSGLARERFHSDNKYPENDKSTVTSGGAGFGVMAILVGIENKFITREQGYQQLNKIVSFLERADKFHGVFPHWWYGETGKVRPFGRNDNGGDLVETSFMLQGLLCVRQYFKDGNAEEKQLGERINQLWHAVDFDWYRNGSNNLYWHWSPDKAWIMNFPVHGFNECLIMYVLGASSPTHPISKEVYQTGWGDKGKMVQSISEGYKGTPLQFRHQGKPQHGGPLFWAHYSFLGLDPNGLKDQYGDYGKEVVNMSMINYQWCADNPKNYKGYSAQNWGLTASYSTKGYYAHAPNAEDDWGVITPTAALSSFPYTPKESMAAMKYWYGSMKDKIWGEFGFYDAFSDQDAWYPKRYLAIDQGPIVVMMENYRTGLLWKLFMSCPEVQNGLKKLGFESPYLK